MAKTFIATTLSVSIALMQFFLLIPVWGSVFGPDSFDKLFYLGLSGVIILILLLVAMIIYPEMPLKKAILGTLIGVGVVLVLDIILFIWAYNNSAF
jgi:hypothetical protein